MRDHTPEPSPSPYADLLVLAERQAELAREGNLAGMEPLWQAWEELTAGLPAAGPASAAPLLRRTVALNERLQEALDELQETLMRDVALTARAGRAARGYAPLGRRAPLVDRTI